MNKVQARILIESTFEQPFEKGRFLHFIREFLNHIDERKAFHARGDVKEMFRKVIKTYERLGTYTDPDGKKIDIIIAYLQKNVSIDRARVTQRNFAGRYLADRGRKHAGLFAFVPPNRQDWRFSLVKMDYEFVQTKAGKYTAREKFSPARRWSFLVGANESSHTAQSRLVKILVNDEQAPTLAELEEAFNIETVTKEFFEKYRDLFIRVKEALDRVVKSDEKIRDDFHAKGVDTVNFAKKLLGQIVFLYFLQKKGWFGVGRDAPWGTGSKRFLRELFEKKHGDYDNFFNDILEPLFYEALRRPRDGHFYSRFNCKIPFLNGGLFDPIGDYDWVHTDILLPDHLFSNNNPTKEGDEGNGILDIFDRYNFTVSEDEPLEKEVAIDPELLGKAYEKFNAIRPDNFEAYKRALKNGKKGEETKFNKQYGVYYTPREIVHYMCQQSLIHYLDAALNESLKGYVTLGEKQVEMFSKKDRGKPKLQASLGGVRVPKKDIEFFVHLGEQVGENEDRVISEGRETSTYSYQLPESIRNNATLIDRKLEEITVCDPAVGSGAFPVGMMHEIVKIRNVLSNFIQAHDRSPYAFKRRCIEHSLYGVDIDPGAVEIAKLRLWLSLVVDEEDIKNIKTLPNLDYKIARGDSLSGCGLRPSGLDKIEELKEKYFSETRPDEKKKLKSLIDNEIHHLFTQISKAGFKVDFDFLINFSEVFHRKDGFDVVIANPPYVRQEAIKAQKTMLKERFGSFFCGTADLYTYFYKRGIEILHDGGHLCFIAPNKFMRAKYGEKTRDLLSMDVTPKVIIDFGDLPIFEATTYPSIILVEKRRPGENENTLAATFTNKEQINQIENTLSRIAFRIKVSDLKHEGWNLERPEVLALMKKLKGKGIPLKEYVKGRFYYGIKTGLNEAFIIDQSTRNRLIERDPKSEELIKPWLRGKDIKRWKAQWAGLYVINIPSSANKDWPWTQANTEIKAEKIFSLTYPAIYNHLSQWRKKLKKRDDQGKFWWELRSCAYYREFEKPKITWGNLATSPQFTMDYSRAYISAPANIIPGNDLYLLGLLNSIICKWVIALQAAVRSGGFLEFKPMYVEQIPVAETPDNKKYSIISLVEKILADPDSPEVPRHEKQIDTLIYELYDLKAKEISNVEGKTK